MTLIAERVEGTSDWFTEGGRKMKKYKAMENDMEHINKISARKHKEKS